MAERDKDELIQAILQQMHASGISIEDLTKSLKTPATPQANSGDLMMKLFSYFGGIFIFCGLGIFVSTIWDDLNSSARVIITLGPGIAAYIMGLMALREERFVGLTTPLLLIAAFMQPAGLFVLIDEFFNNGGDARYAGLLVFGVLTLQQAVTFASYRRTLLALTSILFGLSTIGIALDLVDATFTLTALVMGCSLMCFGKALHDSPHRILAGPAYFFGSLWFLCGGFDWVFDTPFELLYIGIIGILIYFSVLFRSRALLFNGVVAMMGYIGYFSDKYFADSLGWPVLLILLGFLFFGMSSAAWKLKRKYF